MGGGDFNFYFDLSLEADGGKPSIRLVSLAKFESIKQKLYLCDGSTIFSCPIVQEDVKQIDVLASINSSHSPVYLKYFSEGNETSRGPSYSLLDDQYFVTGLTERIDYVTDNESKMIEDARVRWDIQKYRIKQYSVKYSKTPAEGRRKTAIRIGI